VSWARGRGYNGPKIKGVAPDCGAAVPDVPAVACQRQGNDRKDVSDTACSFSSGAAVKGGGA
jgi:hypothetical protein